MLNLSTQDTERALPHVRWMIKSDMPAVLEIEAAACNHPWMEEDFNLALLIDNVLGAVAERGDQIVGYMLYEVHSSTIELFKLEVAPSARRTGVGRALLAKLVSKLEVGCGGITTVVNERNLETHLWLRALGFAATHVLRGHFHERPDDPPEDGYHFQYDLPCDGGGQ